MDAVARFVSRPGAAGTRSFKRVPPCSRARREPRATTLLGFTLMCRDFAHPPGQDTAASQWPGMFEKLDFRDGPGSPVRQVTANGPPDVPLGAPASAPPPACGKGATFPGREPVSERSLTRLRWEPALGAGTRRPWPAEDLCLPKGSVGGQGWPAPLPGPRPWHRRTALS